MEKRKTKKQILLSMLIVLMIVLGALFVGCGEVPPNSNNSSNNSTNQPSDLPQVNDVTLTINVNDANFGTVVGAGTYQKGTKVQVVASPKSGYYLESWKGSGINGIRKIMEITLNENTTINANFAVGEAIECENYVIRCKGEGARIVESEYDFNMYILNDKLATSNKYVSHWTDKYGDIVGCSSQLTIFKSDLKDVTSNAVLEYKPNFHCLGLYVAFLSSDNSDDLGLYNEGAQLPYDSFINNLDTKFNTYFGYSIVGKYPEEFNKGWNVSSGENGNYVPI